METDQELNYLTKSLQHHPSPYIIYELDGSIAWANIAANYIFNLDKKDIFKDSNDKLVLLENIRFYPEEEKNEEQFAQDYLQAFIDQKAKPMYLAGMAAYEREAPLRQFLDSAAGGPIESFSSPAQYKKAVLDAGITEKDVDMIAMKLSGTQQIEPVGRTQINTKSYRNIRRPGAQDAITAVLKM